MKFLALLALPALLAADSLKILPELASLRGPEARHQFLAEATSSSHQEDWTKSAKWTSSNPAVATVNAAGLVTPVSDGDTVISAEANAATASAKVHVTATRDPFAWTFVNDVLPVMTKAGCNQGACHGALAGKMVSNLLCGVTIQPRITTRSPVYPSGAVFLCPIPPIA